MNWIPVKSSNISAVRYLEASKTLEVNFTSGTIYEYANVPAGVYDEMMAAESLGGAFNRLIRRHPEAYPYRQVG